LRKGRTRTGVAYPAEDMPKALTGTASHLSPHTRRQSNSPLIQNGTEEDDDNAPQPVGYLRNLIGPLGKYNNTFIRPKRLPPLQRATGDFINQFEASVGENLVLVVGGSNFDQIRDHRDHVRKSEKLLQEDKDKTATSGGNNRGSTKLSRMIALSNEIRTSLKRLNVHPRKTFQDMDTDGNGSINQTEMHLGLHHLGINVSAQDVELMWPMFDAGECLRLLFAFESTKRLTFCRALRAS
jgi:hypothetical protein